MKATYFAVVALLLLGITAARADMSRSGEQYDARSKPADAFSYEYSDGNLAARVTFQRSSTNLDRLLVVLENVSSADVTSAEQLLTGVFFDIHTDRLDPLSAVLTRGSFI